MSEARPLPPSALCRRCDPGSFAFATTADLADVPGIIGQERAEEAVRFAIGIRRYGYNLYALGTSELRADVVEAAEKARNFGRGVQAQNGTKAAQAPKPPEPAPPGPPPPTPPAPPADPEPLG